MITIPLLIVLLILSAIFAGSETALFLMAKDRNAIQREKNELGDNSPILRLLQHPGRLLMSILLGNLFVNLTFFACSSIFIVWISETISAGAGVVASLFFLGCVLVFGEILPKTIATALPVAFSKRTAYFMLFVVKSLNGLTYVLHIVVIGLNRLFGIEKEESGSVDPAHLEAIVNVSESHGTLSDINAEIIAELLKMNTILLKEVSKPRIDIKACSLNDTVQEVKKKSLEWGYHAIPLYEEHHDNVVRYIEIADVMAFKEPQLKAKYFSKELTYLPELMKMDQVLRVFLEKELRLAVVVNEYGEMTGVISWEAVITCLNSQMSEIEYEGQQHTIKYINGREKVKKILPHKDNEENEMVTLSGYLISKFDRVPLEGERIDIRDKRFIITKANNKNIEEVLVSDLEEEEKE